MPTAVTFTAGAALGTSPPVFQSLTFPSFQDDDHGTIQFGTGTAPTTGALVTITLGGNYSNVLDASDALLPKVSALNAVTNALGLYVSSWTSRSFVVSCTVAPAASQANTTYVLAYWT